MILYQKNEDGFEICLIKSDANPRKSDWYILKKDDVTNIVHNVQNWKYCAIIGHPRSQKSHILKAVNEKIKNKDNTVCILLDMKSISFEVIDRFLYNFANLFKSELKKYSDIVTLLSPEDVLDTRSLQKFISEYVKLLNKNMVLLIDHIEKIQMKPRQLLFETFNEIKSEGDRRLAVAIAISFSALDLSYSFKSDHSTFMKDLSPEASAKLIDCIFEQKGMRITPGGRQHLVEITAGDRHLILVLCKYSANKADESEVPKAVNKPDAKKAIKKFFDKEADWYQPLQKSIKAIEADISSLLYIIEILEHGKVALDKIDQKEWVPKFDKLLITGAVRYELLEDQKIINYAFRNKIFEIYFRKHFHPERVVNLLTSAGQWKKAVEYLENEILNEPEKTTNYHWIYLGTVVHSIYAASSKEEIYASIVRALRLVFGITKVGIYIENPERIKLVLVEHNGFNKDTPKELSFDDKKYQTIIDSYKKKTRIVTLFPMGEKVLLIPLKKEEGKRLGMVAISEFVVFPDDTKHLSLNAFLNRAGRAIGRVIDRELKLKQLTTLYQMGLDFYKANISKEDILRKTIESIIQESGVKAADILLLKDTHKPELCLKLEPLSHISMGYDFDPGEKIRPRPNGLAYEVLTSSGPMPQFVSKPNMPPGINESFLKRDIKACLCLPLSIRESIIGVMYLHFDEEHSFSPNEIDMFYLFANQAATAIEYIRHVDRLNSLLGISTGLVSKLDPDSILKSIAKTIVELLDAKRSLFLIIDSKHRVITKKTSHNYTSEHLRGLFFDQIMKGASGKVLKSGKPFFHENAQSEEVNIEEALESAERFNTGPLIVAPLIVKRKAINSVTGIHKTTWENDQTDRIDEEIIGTLTAVRELGSPVFTKNDVDLACTLANLAAIAINNARLYNDLQESHDKLKDYVDKLEELDQKKSDFVSNVTHELLSPLSKMKSICENILQGKFDTLTMNQAKAIIEIDKYTDEESGSISSCLEFAEIEYGSTSLKKEKININNIIEDVFGTFKSEAKNRKIEFKMFLTKNDMFTLVDSTKFRMIIRNLLHNAIKFTPNSGDIFISSLREGNNICISVRNTGEGIPKSQISKVFEKFHQVENATTFTGDKGKGIGLYTVKSIVKLLEGNISVSSIPNKETIFSLIMPIKEA